MINGESVSWTTRLHRASTADIEQQTGSSHASNEKQVTLRFALRVRHRCASRRMGFDFGGRHYLHLGLELRQASYRARLPNLAPSCAGVGHCSASSAMTPGRPEQLREN
jgi:hypothetical protein